LGLRRAVNVQAKILEVSEPREVMTRFGAARVATAVIGDETGRINLALWNEQIDSVAVDNTIEIENGYVTEFHGTKQLNIGRYGTLKVTREPRDMHKAACSDCGMECEVPFKPDPSRTVYCPECLAKRKQRRHTHGNYP
jgi:CxxC-x17-CxxC domain-containing protein